jgi:site-specific DNA-methyltransferase (adenine-specific)
MTNMLYYGDNLPYLREREPDSVDLVYLDPPFNSKATYNLLFHTPEGDAVQAQTAAFKDTWTWETCAANEAFEDVVASGSKAGDMLIAFRKYLGQSDMMAYLCMMSVRLIELRRVLKPTGSLYLHCDPTAGHYLKILLDGIFGPENFKSEITWKRTTSHGNVSHNYGAVADHLFFYAKSNRFTWNQLYSKFDQTYVDQKFRWSDPDGRIWQSVTLRNPSRRPNLRYPYTASNGITYEPHPNGWSCDLTRMQHYDRQGRMHFPTKPGGQLRLKMYHAESHGVRVQNIWSDIPAVNSQAKERTGYPTQKPLDLLKRVVLASSNPGDVVLDPFCGCGTTIEAAQVTDRSWVGIDITHHAIEVIEGRLRRRCEGADYKITGRPEDLGAARALAAQDKYEFQWWCLWLVGSQSYRERKKGPDKGIDGVIYFRNGPWGVGQTIVSVKGGENVGVQAVNELTGVVQRDDAQLGVLICFDTTRRMLQDAAASGMVQTAQGRFQRIRS